MHQPVLLSEVVQLLNIKSGGRYVDGTLGLGGHAEAIAKQLSSEGRLLGLDVDSSTLPLAESRLQPFGNLTITRQVNFRGLQRVLRDLGWEEVDGMLFDLGFSSAQMDNGMRGFSFQQEGPLDMRLEPTATETALSVLQKIKEERFVEELQKFGETRNARRTARRILSEVASGRIKTTRQLAEFCEQLLGHHGKTHPATRVFLTLRYLVNQEEEALVELLAQAPGCLKVGGRLLIISFQSVEDKLVKDRFRVLSKQGEGGKSFSLVNPKPIEPSEEEIAMNPRARSAKLRVLERVA